MQKLVESQQDMNVFVKQLEMIQAYTLVQGTGSYQIAVERKDSNLSLDKPVPRHE